MEVLTRTCSYDRMNVQRLFARGFVVLGGIIWVAAAFGADYSYQGASVSEAVGTAVLPLLLALVTLAVGWFYERLAAYLLFAGAAATIVWGVVAAWELFVWGIMASVLIGPMLIAAVLFLLAARMQAICGSGDQGAEM